MLARLRELGEVASLVPDSGVQFLDLALDRARMNQPWRLRFASDGAPEVVSAEDDAETAEEESVALRPRDALQPYLGRWLPAPFLRLQARGAWRDGPTNWARIRIVELDEPDDGAARHRLTIAFATELVETRGGQRYVAPSPEDARNGASFELVASGEPARDFAMSDWVAGWLDEMFDGRAGRRVAGALPAHAEAQAPLAAYLTVLASLGADLCPRIRFLDTFSSDRTHRPIEVDLVLDIGNSRTCGVLIEDAGGRRGGFPGCHPLELRDLGEPHLVHSGAFPSRIEFARASFGYDFLAARSGRFGGFDWPSVARVGHEALRLSHRTDDSVGQTGLSSPKRYLWDRQATARDWMLNPHATHVPGEAEAVVSTEFAQSLREDGEPRGGDEAPPVNGRFSRSSLMIFFIAEILMQAAMAVNAPGARGDRAHEDEPRRLRRVVLTMPTAAPLAERRIYRARLDAARDIVWRLLGQPPETAPETVVKWDEATGAHMVFLYNEIMGGHGGDVARFFHAAARARGRPPERDRAPELRLASIDIGGGTSDLSITRFRLAGEEWIEPVQEFRESFNAAGDDILREIVSLAVLPPIVDALAAAGARDPSGLSQRLFGDDFAGLTERDRARRRGFAIQVATPIALAMVAAYEGWTPEAASDARPEELAWGDVFAAADPPSPDVIAYVEEAAAKAGAHGFRLAEIRFPMDMARIDAVADSVIREPLGDLLEAVGLAGCDWLLLAGRPSLMPAVKARALRALPVTPDRVVALHDYRVGGWHPFRDPDGRLGDPKTTAAVGALICALFERGRLDGVLMGSDGLHFRSTARHLGVMERGARRVRDDKLLFRDLDLDIDADMEAEAPVVMAGSVDLGFRQMRAERWPATPLYRLDIAEHVQAQGGGQTLKLPLKVTLGRRLIAEGGEIADFEIRDVADATDAPVHPRAVTLSLRTLRNDYGHWLDSGVLETQS